MALRRAAETTRRTGLSVRLVGQRGEVVEVVIGVIVVDIGVALVLFIDLHDPSVLDVVGRENFRRFPFEEEGGVGATAINNAADDEHGSGMVA